MKRKSYPSDLSDKEWEIIESLIPPPKTGGRPRTTDIREIVNAIFYILRGSIAWRMLPHDFPNWSTVWTYWRNWRISGLWEVINKKLREQLRIDIGRESTPSASIIDSQSVKTTEQGGERGYDGGKKNKRKKTPHSC